MMLRRFCQMFVLCSAGALAMGCTSNDGESAPKLISVLSMDGDLVFAEQQSQQLLWFHLLGSQGSPLPAPVISIDGTLEALRCLSADGEVVSQGECGSADGATLLLCLRKGGASFLQRFHLGSSPVDDSTQSSVIVAPEERLPVDVDCSRMSTLDGNTIVLIAPELFDNGIPRFQQTSAAAFASVIDLDARQELAIHAAPSALAPVGAESDALLRVELFEDYAAFVFRSYVGVAPIREDASAGIQTDQVGEYRFIDLFDYDGAAEEPSAADAPLVHVADSRLLIAMRRGSVNAFAAPLPDFQFLSRLTLPERVSDMRSFQFGASDRLLIVTEPDQSGKSHLHVISPFPFELAPTEALLPGPANVLIAPNRRSSAATALTAPAILAWNNGANNTTLNVVAPELVPIPNASAVRSFAVEAGFSEAFPIGSDIVVLASDSEASPKVQFLIPSEGVVRPLLQPGEVQAGAVTLFGPFISTSEQRDGSYSQIFVNREGLRVSELPLRGPPVQTLKFSACSPCCLEDSACNSAPLRMAVLFDHPLGQLDLISGLPPTLRDSVEGFLAAALWRNLP